MGGFVSLLIRNYRIAHPPIVAKSDSPIRVGILGAARIAPNAIILPARHHSEILVAAVAARDAVKAKRFAQNYQIPKVYSGVNGYQDLLNDPEIDAIYNPLPNGLHFEWSMKALAAGKHVLLEKPVCNNADETKRLFAYAKHKNLVLLEAFHYRFHPAIHRLKEILSGGDLGKIKHITTTLMIPKGTLLEKNDIRLQYPLGGGSMMDMGYCLSAARFLTSSEPLSVARASPTLYTNDRDVDIAMSADLIFPNDVTVTIDCDYHQPWFLGFIPSFPKAGITVDLEGGSAHLSIFPSPHLYHSITVKSYKAGTHSEQAFTFKDGEVKGEDYWSTYRYMVEAFADKVKGRIPRTWIEAEDSIHQMEWIDRIYQKAALPLRPSSTLTSKELDG